MAQIKKFKNGKIKISLELKYDINDDMTINENVYHDDMTNSDLCINQINGCLYIVDYNTSIVYLLGSSLLQNPLKYILDILQEDKKLYLYPCNSSKSKSLLQDLERGQEQ